MNDLKDVEIFAAGTHNGDAYTVADLDAMVAAFTALDFKPALRIGHAKPGDNESETPAIGWVENVRREGDKLVADFTNVADEVMALIRRKAFTRVSSEVFWNFERAGRKFARVLKAVALLGVGIPGVAGLRPLAASFAVGLFGEAQAKAYTADLIYPQSQKESIDMDQKEIEKIAKDAADAAVAAVIKTFDTQLQAEKDARIASEKAHATALTAERARIDATLAGQAAARVKQFADSCKLPALRPFVAAFAELAVSAPVEKKYTLGQGADKKDIQASPVETVEKFIAEVNAKVERLYKETGHSSVPGANDDPAGEKAYLDSRSAAGIEVDKRARDLMAKEGKLDYSAATDRVLAADGELKAAYTGAETKRAA